MILEVVVSKIVYFSATWGSDTYICTYNLTDSLKNGFKPPPSSAVTIVPYRQGHWVCCFATPFIMTEKLALLFSSPT